jgi:hypothetical protein
VVGTSGRGPAVLYWLEEDAEHLRGYVGQRVELRGKVKGDIDTGKIEIKRKDAAIEVKFEVDGDEVKVALPRSQFVLASDDDDVEMKIAVRKVDVEDIRTLSATCDR